MRDPTTPAGVLARSREATEEPSLIGRPVRRKEDHRLLTGRGCYSDDIDLPGQVYAIFVRSPHAHARIGAIAIDGSLAVPGVIAVLTGRDAAADGLRPLPHLARMPFHPPDIALRNRDGSEFKVFPHLPLPSDKARFVGEAVAVVIGETLAAARDGAEQIIIDWEPLSPVIGVQAALTACAPRVWDGADFNTVIDAETGDAEATDAMFERAAHTVRLETAIHRATGVPLEPRAAVGIFDPATERYTLFAGSSGVVRYKVELADVLAVRPDRVRVIARDVGGNFGTKNSVYPEFAVVLWASRRVGRPVKWTCERNEAFLSDYQGRDLWGDAELALDADGQFLAVRASLISNLGAHTISFIQIFKATSLITSVYDIVTAHVRARAVMTNSPPTHPLRSTGRPEAMFVIERLIDLAAREHGFDPIALRRRNLIREAALPYRNPIGLTYDSGAYERTMDAALDLIDYRRFVARRREAARRGRCLGLGIANYIEITSGNPREYTRITVLPARCVEVVIGTMSSGQGHETSFAQVVADELGVPFDGVRLVTGDTDTLPAGGGSHSGRSMRFAGIVIGKAAHRIIALGKRIAARVLEASESDVEFDSGVFYVAGTNRHVGIFDVAASAEQDGVSMSAVCDENILTAGFPYGCHACEIEVDPETGSAAIVRYGAVDDVGRAINPLILHGQTHGGVTHGIGQALSEHCHYDAQSGQLLSASLMDYGLPRAVDVPSFLTELSEVPATNNRLGVRAGGEGGVTPTLGVIIGALVDALAGFGILHIEMPATPERIWQAIRSARTSRMDGAASGGRDFERGLP